MLCMTCNCLVELAHVFLDKTFTYIVPDEFCDSICVGMRVEVPFGNRVLLGFVMSVSYENSFDDLKSIIRPIDSYPVLNDELMSIGNFIKNSTLCSLMSAYQVMLPKALKAKSGSHVNIKYNKFVSLSDMDLSLYKFNKTQEEIISYVKKHSSCDIKYVNEISSSSVKTLIKKGVLLLEAREVYRYNLCATGKGTFALNKDQVKVFDSISSCFCSSSIFLLYGVTGSGKTNVYMKLIESVISSGRTALFLVPEISLTPQIINRFTSYFSRIAVLHSKLSDSEKYDEWRKINEGKVDIVIGARSAVFAPLKNIGIIIVDEEHTSTYKQENIPRYNAIDIAKFRSKYHKCPLVLGSATPTIESYTRALRGEYNLVCLPNRYNGMNPDISIIDMNKEFKKSNGYFSDTLISEIKRVISNKEQVILFLNKRGYSNIVTCKSCGYTEKCPNCDISLTYHKSSNMLRCHYCGYAKKKSLVCESCGETLVDYGIGTEKVEEELSSLISDARIIRMDVDTTSKKGSLDKIINDFSSDKYNILLGTQMIAKGLDFPSVTLVGVISADISLNFPDFRSSEVTFSLLNQVSGRSGRGLKKGKVLIQTFNPDHYAIKCSASNDYISFYNEELKIRKKLNYPPYCHICLLKISSKDYDFASSMSYKIGKYLKEKISSEIVLGPSTANIFRLNNEYRFQIIIKYRDINNIKKYLVMLEERFFNDKKVRVDIDFNPVRM